MIRLVVTHLRSRFLRLVRLILVRLVRLVRLVLVARSVRVRASPPHRMRVRHANERPRPQRRERDAVSARRPYERVRQQERHAAAVATAGDKHAQTGGVLGEHVNVQTRDGVSPRARRARTSAGAFASAGAFFRAFVARRSKVVLHFRVALVIAHTHRRDRRRRGGGGDAQLAAVALALEQARRAQVRNQDAPASCVLAAHRRAEKRAPTRQGVAGEYQPPAPRGIHGMIHGLRSVGILRSVVPIARRARVAGELD